jgi:DnaJ-class molecular chaperone
MLDMAKKIIAAVKKAVKKTVVKKKVKKEEVALTECAECTGRGLETSYTLCRYCHGSGRV